MPGPRPEHRRGAVALPQTSAALGGDTLVLESGEHVVGPVHPAGQAVADPCLDVGSRHQVIKGADPIGGGLGHAGARVDFPGGTGTEPAQLVEEGQHPGPVGGAAAGLVGTAEAVA